MPEIVHTDTGRQSKDPAEGTYFLCASHTQAEQPHTSSVHVLEERGREVVVTWSLYACAVLVNYRNKNTYATYIQRY